MKFAKLNSEYWNQRYIDGKSGWDIGGISTPLKAYFNQLKNKDLRILIPGAGNAYEVEYLFKNGFKNIFLVDWASQSIANFKERVDDFPAENLICNDFFKLDLKVDLIIEQTFFCALNPNLREKYVVKCNDLLQKNGKLVGLLFNKNFDKVGPPFGGTAKEYKNLFQPFFDIEIMEEAHNSIKPRKGNELFIKFKKKNIA